MEDDDDDFGLSGVVCLDFASNLDSPNDISSRQLGFLTSDDDEEDNPDDVAPSRIKLVSFRRYPRDMLFDYPSVWPCNNLPHCI